RRFRRTRPLRGLGRTPAHLRLRPRFRPGSRLGFRIWRLRTGLRLRRVWLRNLILAAAVVYLLVRIGDLLLLQPLKAVAEVEARRLGAAAVNRVVAGQVSQSLA